MNDFDLGRSIAEITLGIDALERASGAGRGALDTEGLVPIFMGADLVTPRAFADWPSAHAALDDVEPGIAALPEGPRKAFLRSMTRSLRTATRLFAGEPLDFATKLTDLVGVPAEPVPDATVAAIHARLEALLRARGYTSGSLGERVRTWERERYLEADALPKVFEELMAVAKRRTDESIFDTRDYTMALNPMRGVPYTARCAFNDGNMDINLDVSFTRSALKHLVCHEVFPGHSTQLLYTRAKAERGESPLDALLCTTNAVTGCVQEGIGDQGIELIDWVEDEDDAAHIEIRRLQTACGTNAAWYLMTGAWTRDEAAQYLRDNAFAQEAWINGRLAMAQHPFRGAFVASYWFGTEAVRTVRERTAPADRPAFLKYLYESLHSPESLLMFAA